MLFFWLIFILESLRNYFKHGQVFIWKKILVQFQRDEMILFRPKIIMWFWWILDKEML